MIPGRLHGERKNQLSQVIHPLTSTPTLWHVGSLCLSICLSASVCLSLTQINTYILKKHHKIHIDYTVLSGKDITKGPQNPTQPWVPKVKGNNFMWQQNLPLLRLGLSCFLTSQQQANPSAPLEAIPSVTPLLRGTHYFLPEFPSLLNIPHN